MLSIHGTLSAKNSASAPTPAMPMIQPFASTSSVWSCAGSASQPNFIARPTASVTRYNRQPARRLTVEASAISSTADICLVLVDLRHAGDLSRRMNQLDRQHGDDGRVVLDADFAE